LEGADLHSAASARKGGKVIGKVIGNFWQKSMDLQFMMFFEMDENFLFGCFGFLFDVF